MFKNLAVLGLAQAVGLQKMVPKCGWGQKWDECTCHEGKLFNLYDASKFYFHWRDDIEPRQYPQSVGREKFIEGFTSYLECGMVVDSCLMETNINAIVSFFANYYNNRPWYDDWEMWYDEWWMMIDFMHQMSGNTYDACAWYDYLNGCGPNGGFKYEHLLMFKNGAVVASETLEGFRET